MALIGIHATRKQREKRILKDGLRAMPFWRSRRPLRHPKEIRFRYPSHANVISGKSFEQICNSVYDALRAANTPYIGTSRKMFDLRKIRLFIVDLDKSKIIGKKDRAFLALRTKAEEKTKIKEGLSENITIEELQLEHAPPESLKPFRLGEEEIKHLEKETRDLGWLEANKHISKFIATKLSGELAL